MDSKTQIKKRFDLSMIDSKTMKHYRQCFRREILNTYGILMMTKNFWKYWEDIEERRNGSYA